jgi:hypothetical protein
LLSSPAAITLLMGSTGLCCPCHLHSNASSPFHVLHSFQAHCSSVCLNLEASK